MLSDEKTPAPMAAKRTLSAELGELAPDAVGASPSDTLEFDAAEMAAWGERVIVHPHLSEKVSTSGDIGRNKGILMNEFPLLALAALAAARGRVVVQSSAPTERRGARDVSVARAVAQV
jgi:hypothetical protein